MLQTRYSLAAESCEGKDVLEIACGAGMGLGLLASKARRLVAGDFSELLLRRARQHYGSRVTFVRLDAHSLPFPDSFFDIVLCFEAIYYLSDPRRFVMECRRILRPSGTLIVCAANPACPGFNPSPYSNRYFSANELWLLFAEAQFRTAVYGAFPFLGIALREKAIALVRSAAARLHVFPRSMKGKELLKRTFYGKLVNVEAEIQAQLPFPRDAIHALSPGGQAQYKILYAIAHR